MAKPFLSVIIPAYNEADQLPLTLIDVDRHLSEQEYSYEIIVVNDGSIDATAEIVQRFISLIPNLKLLDNPNNQGKGMAVKQGMISAKGNWRVYMDADNSTSIVEFNKMMPYLKEGYDIVIGSRFFWGSRRIFDIISNLMIRFLLLKGIWDPQCAFKCFSEEAANKIFTMTKIDKDGFDVEALALAKTLGYKIKEVPVFWRNQPSIKQPSRFKRALQLLWETARIRWRLWRHKYENLEFRS